MALEFRPLTMWDDPWGDESPLYPVPEGDPTGPGDPYIVPGVPATPRPPDQPGGHWEQLPNGGWRFIDDAPAAPAAATTNWDYGGGGGGGGGGTFRAPPSRPSFNFSSAPIPNLPQFSYAPMAAIEKFNAPTGDAVLNEPGYAFREKQGRQALEQSAAGKGLLRTGGTLKDLIAYGQQFASNEYGNVYNRAKGEYDTDVDNRFRTYGTNYGVARDVFDREYKRASDLYAPTFAEWQFRNNAELQGGLAGFDREWDDYINDKNLIAGAG